MLFSWVKNARRSVVLLRIRNTCRSRVLIDSNNKMKMLFEEGKCDTWMTFIVGMETCLMMLDCLQSPFITAAWKCSSFSFHKIKSWCCVFKFNTQKVSSWFDFPFLHSVTFLLNTGSRRIPFLLAWKPHGSTDEQRKINCPVHQADPRGSEVPTWPENCPQVNKH